MNDIIRYSSNHFYDDRGFFLPIRIQIEKPSQINYSHNFKGTIRGMHAQKYPFGQTKQLMVLEGTINDVILDINTKKVKSFKLEEGEGLFVPVGYFHGFEVLSEQALVMYIVDKAYNPRSELCINPMSIGHVWETDNPILSDKDKEAMTLSEYIKRIK